MPNRAPLFPKPKPKAAPGGKNKQRKTSFSSFVGALFTQRKQQPNFIFSVGVSAIKLVFILVLVVSIAGVGMVMGVAKAYAETIPDLDTGKITDQSLSSFIYDRNGELITTYRGAENRILVTINEIPANLKNAFVAVEDARFFTHNGVDIKRIAGAFVNNMRNDSVQGGSTITQQLVKLHILSMEQTYKRKIQEAYLALEIEKEYSKDQILEWYLNTIWLGESNYGVLAAVRDYFGKELKDLTLRECATLAGITRNPTRYNPRRCVYTTNTPEISVDRTNYVLSCMYENNFITEVEYREALGEMPGIKQRYDAKSISEETYRSLLKANIRVVEKTTASAMYDMPAAVESVLYDVENAFMNMRGMQINETNRKTVRKEIQSGGYRIYSTIDPVVQKIAEDIVYNWDKYPETANASHSVIRDVSASGVVTEVIQPQAGVSIFDYSTGEIVAIVGGRTPPTGLLEYNRGRSSEMPVGSSIKPISVYGPALDMGYSPGSVTSNLPVPIPGWGTAKGYPSNSTRGDFKGYVTIRQAMRMSLNTAAANTLMNYVHINDSKNYLMALGVNPDHLNADGFGLSLGSSGITPMEMSVAFGTIANKGTYQQPLTFTKVLDSLGNVVIDMKAEQQNNKRQVFRPSTSWMMVDLLVDAVQVGIARSAKIDGITVGGKTGTNSDYVGVSFSGITPYYACSVWVGADRSYPLKAATGSLYAAPLWQAIMERVHSELQLENKPIIQDDPESLGLVKATTCSLSGLLATDACSADANFTPVTDWWHADSAPTESCDKHVMAQVCPETGLIAGPNCPGAYAKPMLLIPEGDPAEQLDPSQLPSLLPGAILRVPAGSSLDALRENPAFASYFCSFHGQSSVETNGQNPGDDYPWPDPDPGPLRGGEG